MSLATALPVNRFEHAYAVELLGALPLDVRNRQLADYWLSLWEGDELPPRSNFDPARVREHLPGIMLMEIKVDCYVRVRLAGTAVNQAFGADLTGLDVIEISPPDLRKLRLARNSMAAEGAATLGVRSIRTRLGKAAESQEIQLPFADFTPDGARLVLFHTSWRPATKEPGVADVINTLGSPMDFRIVPLWRSPSLRNAAC